MDDYKDQEESNAEREARLLKAQNEIDGNPDEKSDKFDKEEDDLKTFKEKEDKDETSEKGKEGQKTEEELLEAEALKQLDEEEKLLNEKKSSKEAEELEAIKRRYAESSAEAIRLNEELKKKDDRIAEIEKKRKEVEETNNPLSKYTKEQLYAHLGNEESKDHWAAIHKELDRRRDVDTEQKRAEQDKTSTLQEIQRKHRDEYLELSKVHPELLKPDSELYKEAGRIYNRMGLASHADNMREAIKLGCLSLNIPFNTDPKQAKIAEHKERLRKIRAAEDAKRKRLSGGGGDKDGSSVDDVKTLADMTQEEQDRFKAKNPKRYRQLLQAANG